MCGRVERCQMIDSGGDAREVRERRRAPLEPIGDVVRRGCELEGSELLQERRISDEATDVRAVPLVSTCHIKVAAQFCDVCDAVSCAVDTIDIDKCTHCMCHL